MSSTKSSDEKRDVETVVAPVVDKDGEGHLNQGFGLLSLLCVAATIGGMWATCLTVFGTGIPSGGPVVLLWGVCVGAFGYLMIALSLGELASAWPNSAGAMEWAWHLAPAHSKRFWSFFFGWIMCVAYTIGVIMTVVLAAQQMIAVSGYSATKWQTYLVIVGLIVFYALLNIFAIRQIPKIEILSLVWFMLSFVIWTTVPAAMAAEHQPASFVFTTVINETGYPDFVAFMIGLSGVSASFAGTDAVTHLAEEVPNPRLDVPRAMYMSVLIGWVMAFASTMSVLFSIVDLEGVLSAPFGGFPHMQIALNATRSHAAMSGLSALLIVIINITALQVILSTSRVWWTFAREGGLPFKATLSHIHPKWQVPIASIVLAAVVQVALVAVYLGPSTALGSFLSLASAIPFFYFTLIIVLLWTRERVFPTDVDFPFKLGRYGWTINILAVVWMVLQFAFLWAPYFIPTTDLSMNYAAPVFVFFVLLTIPLWFLHGRQHFAIERLAAEQAALNEQAL